MLEITYDTNAFDQAEDGTITPSGRNYTLRFDAVVSEKATFSADLPGSSIERAQDVREHKHPKPTGLVLVCIVSNTPLGNPPESGSRTGNVTGELSSIDLDWRGRSAQGLVYSEPVTRRADVLAELADLTMRPVMVTVRTDDRTYENMQVKNVVAGLETARMDGAFLELTISLEESRAASASTTTEATPRDPRNQSSVSRGVQQPREGSEAQMQRGARSLFSGIFY